MKYQKFSCIPTSLLVCTTFIMLIGASFTPAQAAPKPPPSDIVIIPEPSNTFSLLTFGALGIGVLLQRQLRQK